MSTGNAETGYRKPGTGNRKGQAFSIDALLAVFVVMLFMLAVINFSMAGRHVTSSIHDEKLADDILATLANRGDLTANATTLNRSLYGMVGAERRYKAEISWYEYRGGAYTLSSRESVGIEPDGDAEVSVSERSIEYYEGTNGTRISNMTQVRLYIWR